MSNNPLGKKVRHASTYSPELLFSLPRDDARRASGIGIDLPFSGVDVWNAWEMTWLDGNSKPVVATAEIRIPAESPRIIESKSLKLYLNSLAMRRYRDLDEVSRIIAADLSAAAGHAVEVDLLPANTWHQQQFCQLPGTCIDEHPARTTAEGVNASLLRTGDDTVELQELYSHLLYTHCPVTNQPDSGSLLIRYSGPRIDAASLLNYIVSFRQHNDFHEACVERIFIDVLQHCAPEKLTVYARYNRRGGIDINPFRSNFEAHPGNDRLWRQ